MKIILILLSSIMMASTAWGSVVFSPGIAYDTTKNEATTPGSVNQESNSLILDLKLGYVLPMGLYVGGMYSSMSSGDGVDDSKGSLIGPSIGYYSMMGFYSLFTYHIMGELDLDSTTKLTGAKGPQIDIGWVFPLSSFFAIGPQMTYRSTEFDKIEGAGTSVDTNYKTTTVEPYVSLWFMF